MPPRDGEGRGHHTPANTSVLTTAAATATVGVRVARRLRRGGQRARIPAGSKLVTRSSRWGNPYRVEEYGRDEAIRRYRGDLLSGRLRFTVDDVIRELAGWDLVCECPLNEACHADVLLEIANGYAQTVGGDAA